MTDGPQLDWKATRDGAKLHLEYTVKNTTNDKIYIVDKLVEPAGGNKFRRATGPIVMNDSPGTVKLALAALSSDRPSATVYTPTFKPLAAGETATGSFDLPWPLKAWNPVGGANPITGTPTSAVFWLGYFPGEPTSWKQLASDDATPLKVPEGFNGNALRVGPKPLP